MQCSKTVINRHTYQLSWYTNYRLSGSFICSSLMRVLVVVFSLVQVCRRFRGSHCLHYHCLGDVSNIWKVGAVQPGNSTTAQDIFSFIIATNEHVHQATFLNVLWRQNTVLPLLCSAYLPQVPKNTESLFATHHLSPDGSEHLNVLLPLIVQKTVLIKVLSKYPVGVNYSIICCLMA